MPPTTDRPPEPVLLVAVSARMLAELAVRAGYDVVALDHFGDLDLQSLCPSVSILRDLGGSGGMAELVTAAEDIAAPSIVYGAGLENRPDLVESIMAGRTLLGNAPAILERVRDPETLAASLREPGLHFPETLAPDRATSADPRKAWLRKPVKGGGGRGIRRWQGGALRSREVVQERIRGLSCSVAAVGDGRDAAVLGVSEQLIGRRALGSSGFRWCGNVVPARLPVAEREALLEAAIAVCAHVARAFELRGLFGVDLIWDGARAWVLEVNPRPTASLEAIEEVYGVSAFTAHVEACAGRLPDIAPGATWPDTASGKGIVFARKDLRAADTRAWLEAGIRDVPHPGEPIGRGHPICTVPARAATPEDVLAALERGAADVLAQCDAATRALA